SSRRRHTSSKRDWSSDVCSSDLRSRTAAGAATALCSTSASRSATGCASGDAGTPRMNDTARLSERIDALEVRLTYQDETIETLKIGRASCREREYTTAEGRARRG